MRSTEILYEVEYQTYLPEEHETSEVMTKEFPSKVVLIDWLDGWDKPRFTAWRLKWYKIYEKSITRKPLTVSRKTTTIE